MEIYANMAYRAPSSPSYLRMTKAQLNEAAAAGDAEAAGELARRRANAEEVSVHGRYLTPEETAAKAARPAASGAAGFRAASSEQHRAMTAKDLREAAARGDASATAELERRAHNRAHRSSK